MKKWISVFLSIAIFFTGFNNMPMRAEAASYASEWWLWDQRNSDDAQMRKAGCRVVAFAKMLQEAGKYGYENPDGLCNWGRENNLINKKFQEVGAFGDLLKGYLRTQGETTADIFPKGTKQARTVVAKSEEGCREIMELINQGYYVFLSRVGSVYHTVYIGREASQKEGTPIVMEYNGGRDFKSYDYSGVQYWELHAFALSGASDFSDAGATSSGSGAEGNDDPITFYNVTQNNITENTAFLKADVTADCSRLSDVGLDWGYVVNGQNQPMTGFNWKVGTKLTYISVDFGKEKDTNGNIPYLEPGKTVYYRFYATNRDGARIYSSSDYYTFQTAPCSHDWREVARKEATSEEAGMIMYECLKCYETKSEYIPQKVPSMEETGDTENEETGAEAGGCIDFNSITASNITATTAFVKADVTADCTKLSAVGMEWGYLSDGMEMPRTEFNWRTGTYLTFISIDFGKEVDSYGNIPTLEAGRTVYYRFFADKKEGGRIYSDTNYFATMNVQEEEPSISVEESWADYITFDTITVSNVTPNTAFVKTTVTADCTKLSAVGMEWGYLADGMEIPQTEFNWRTGTYLNFISIDFGKEIDKYGNVPRLEAGRTVYYRFFADKKEGGRIYSDTGWFTT